MYYKEKYLNEVLFYLERLLFPGLSTHYVNLNAFHLPWTENKWQKRDPVLCDNVCDTGGWNSQISNLHCRDSCLFLLLGKPLEALFATTGRGGGFHSMYSCRTERSMFYHLPRRFHTPTWELSALSFLCFLSWAASPQILKFLCLRQSHGTPGRLCRMQHIR